MDAKRVPSSRLLSWEFKEARVAWGSLCPSLAASHPGFAHTVTLFVPGSWSTSGREDSKGFKFSLLKLLTSKRLEAPLAVWWLWCPRALTLEGELGVGGGKAGRCQGGGISGGPRGPRVSGRPCPSLPSLLVLGLQEWRSLIHSLISSYIHYC